VYIDFYILHYLQYLDDWQFDTLEIRKNIYDFAGISSRVKKETAKDLKKKIENIVVNKKKAILFKKKKLRRRDTKNWEGSETYMIYHIRTIESVREMRPGWWNYTLSKSNDDVRPTKKLGCFYAKILLKTSEYKIIR
jgi:hypothetical protein